MAILLKSIIEPAQSFDGPRYLIEYAWPSHLGDLDFSPYRWVRELVPSYDLMEKQLWGHDSFRKAYWTELERAEAQRAIQKMFCEQNRGHITLLYASSSSMKSNAYYLKRFIDTYGCPVIPDADAQPAENLAA
jgi:uncharacterized protein YeaO (DUF488 family)